MLEVMAVFRIKNCSSGKQFKDNGQRDNLCSSCGMAFKICGMAELVPANLAILESEIITGLTNTR
jgi:hypothetical protein